LTLYKIKSDGTGQTRLNRHETYAINFVGGWIYYRNGSDGAFIYKIQTDGTNRQKVIGLPTFPLQILDTLPILRKTRILLQENYNLYNKVAGTVKRGPTKAFTSHLVGCYAFCWPLQGRFMLEL
jgi:hypothetical protein